jgi:hypothetical protein
MFQGLLANSALKYSICKALCEDVKMKSVSSTKAARPESQL